MGWRVSGRDWSGTLYPKLQIWRRSNTDRNVYFKNGPEIQIDAQGSACELISRNENCAQEYHCRLSAAYHVPILAGSDIIGLELPPFHNQAFSLLFLLGTNWQKDNYVWRREVNSSSLTVGTQDITVRNDEVLIKVDVVEGE